MCVCNVICVLCVYVILCFVCMLYMFCVCNTCFVCVCMSSKKCACGGLIHHKCMSFPEDQTLKTVFDSSILYFLLLLILSSFLSSGFKAPPKKQLCSLSLFYLNCILHKKMVTKKMTCNVQTCIHTTSVRESMCSLVPVIVC